MTHDLHAIALYLTVAAIMQPALAIAWASGFAVGGIAAVAVMVVISR